MIKNKRDGQAMIIAILTLGGAMLGATALAGFLMLYQIRASTDSENSAKAIFAADTGVNWALYSYFDPPGMQLPELPDGASIDVTCYDANNNVLPCTSTSSAYVISIGSSTASRRAFLLQLTNATASVP